MDSQTIIIGILVVIIIVLVYSNIQCTITKCPCPSVSSYQENPNVNSSGSLSENSEELFASTNISANHVAQMCNKYCQNHNPSNVSGCSKVCQNGMKASCYNLLKG